MTREEAIEHLKEWKEVISSGHRKAIIDMATDALSADVVQGEWKRVPTRTYKGECTNCGFRHIFMDGHDSQYRFCPYCGAKMSKGGDSE